MKSMSMSTDGIRGWERARPRARSGMRDRGVSRSLLAADPDSEREVSMSLVCAKLGLLSLVSAVVLVAWPGWARPRYKGNIPARDGTWVGVRSGKPKSIK